MATIPTGVHHRSAPIALHNPSGAQDGANIVERIKKMRLSTAKKPSGSELLRIIRKHMRLKPKVVYVDHHRRETLRVSPEGNRPVMIGAEARSRARLIK